MTAKNQTSGTPQVLRLEQVLRLVQDRCAAGRLDEAEDLLSRILSAQPEEVRAIHMLGLIAQRRGQTGRAIGYLEQVISLAPEVALYRANLGEMYRLAGQPGRAIEHGERALLLQPAYPEALSNIGAAYYDKKDYPKALANQCRAIALKPDFALAYSNAGNALHALRRFDEAVEHYRRAVALNPDFTDAWANLGTCLHHSGSYDEAIVALRRAIALEPGNANAHSGLGILLLMRGDFAEGWAEYEWRLKSTEVRLPYQPQRPWQGESLNGRHIYIHAEQGFGDTMQFARYVPLVAARASKVTFRVQQGLAGLMRQSFAGIEVLGDRSASMPSGHFECALMSLPHIFGTRLETIPASVPYLRADETDTARWRKRFSSLAGLKVGLAWSGNPEHVNDWRRSIDLAELAPLFAVSGASFVSLQVGPRAADIAQRPAFRILDVSHELTPFAETAAAIAALDLVISSDTSIVHLAGAMAKPAWLLTSWLCDWRWLLNRDDSPWYPSLRLFRQARGEAWSAVASRAALELAKASQCDRGVLTPFRSAGESRAAIAAEIIAAQENRIVSPPQAPNLSLPQVLALADSRRQAGKLGEAEMLARRVLDVQVDNAEAHHLLGIIAHQSGNLAHAIEHVKKATALAPGVALYHANLCEMYRLAGRLREAIASGERALTLNPDYPDALNNLGITLYEQKQYEKAIALYSKAIRLNPDFAPAHSNLGNVLRALGRLDEAIPCYRRALEMLPQFADGWNNLGTTLRDLKKFEEAEDAYRKALALKPDDPDILNSLALCVRDLDRQEEAEHLLQRSLAIESNKPETLLYLGILLLDDHQPDRAAVLLERALALEPGNADIVNNVGRAALDLGDVAAAAAYFRRALDMNPDHADTLNNLGNVLKQLGRLTEAREAYLQALAIDPTMTGIYFNYAEAEKFTSGNPHLKAMETMRHGQNALSNNDRIRLDFALGKAHADLGDHKRSFEYLLSGNKAKRANIQYDEAATLARFERIKFVFTAKMLREKAELRGGNPSHLPIFIVGMPRSGSTLVEQILASHPDVHGGDELSVLPAIAGDMPLPDGNTLPYPEYVPALDMSAIDQIGSRYLAEISRLNPKAARITDKMPSNYDYVGLIHLVLPNAYIIHTVRDPLDTCVSCFSKLFTAKQNHTYDLAELGRYYLHYQKLMAHWHGILPEGRILDVRYEDVVADLEGQARRILAHCGVSWDARCLSFHTTERPVRTASASQVRKPIYNSAIGRAHAYEEFLGPLRDALA